MLTLKSFTKHVAVAAALIAPLMANAATAGPGTWSSQQTWATDNVNGGNLTGFYYWPATQPAHANGKRALVLVLHGCLQTAANDVVGSGTGGYNWKATADKYGAVILAPNATGNVSSSHCWDYSRTGHSRSNGHEYVLLDLINRFVTNTQYDIDPNQVYVTGLSSGGGETLVLGCIAPDIFAGFGDNAGPVLGTTTLQIGSVPSGVTASTVASQCKSLAGSNASKFSTQIAGDVWGTSDFTVAQGYGPMTSAAMRIVYGGTFTQQPTQSISGGGSNTPYNDSNGKLRTHEISVSGMSHAWPAGSGGQGTNYVDNSHINYPMFVMDFWFKNNLRATNDGGTTTTTTTTSGGGTTTTTSSGSTTTTTAGGGTTTTTSSTTTTTIASSNCYTASNTAHVAAGRAFSWFGFDFANGSNQYIGYNSSFYITSLQQMGNAYYLVGSCK
jgi:poly(3-hydroxybutyrate) depolymerase